MGDVGFRSASEHHANWSAFIDKVSRYVDWCIQYALMVRMARGKLSHADWVNGRDMIGVRAKKAMNETGGKGGSVVKDGRHKDKIETGVRLAGMGRKVEAASEFISIGGEFLKKAMEMGVLRAAQKVGVVMGLAPAVYFVHQQPLAEPVSYSRAA
ncbi:hypothetical protein J4441_02755 [Candidatus Micrarchaeota archaeon]|nr:hypothetical protein [Candidatus Micrarchaeota archaeon]